MSPKQERHCLVTVGATAGFKSLIETVLLPEFWNYLASKGFTSLHIQCGPDQAFAAATIQTMEKEIPAGLTIKSFELCKDLLNEEMKLCKASTNRKQGLIISHAGNSFSLLMALSRKCSQSGRHWHHFGRLEDIRPNDCRSQHRFTRRSPDRVGRASRRVCVCNHEQYRVWFHVQLTLSNQHPIF